eukprot:scaffold62758_cov20-Tisochrysis_lutea.AAC.3
MMRHPAAASSPGLPALLAGLQFASCQLVQAAAAAGCLLAATRVASHVRHHEQHLISARHIARHIAGHSVDGHGGLAVVSSLQLQSLPAMCATANSTCTLRNALQDTSGGCRILTRAASVSMGIGMILKVGRNVCNLRDTSHQLTLPATCLSMVHHHNRQTTVSQQLFCHNRHTIHHLCQPV